ncbi:MAG: hypothetical protein IKD55_07450 [Sediminibacterium sp.]|nr:hypothetical protein [Sediminibacterium sp.]MBX9780469.1 hypothetical protein [Chitinophagaceae bacterium]
MKNKILKSIILLALSLNSVGILKAQITAGFATGASAYFGDLISTPAFFQQMSPSISGDIGMSLGSRLRARFNIAYLQVRGDDKKSPYWPTRNRNLNFKSDIWELSAIAEFDIFKSENVLITPYLFGGPGIFIFDPTTIDRNGNKVHLKYVGTSGQITAVSALSQEGKQVVSAPRQAYETQASCMVAGIGFRVPVGEMYTIGVELGYRFTNTDNLDDVSEKAYPAKGSISSYAYSLAFRGDEVIKGAEPGWQPRGNPDVKDSYYSIQVRVAKTLNFSRSPYKKWYQ